MFFSVSFLPTMSCSLSESEFLRAEIVSLQKQNLDLDYENKCLKRELADHRVDADLKYKNTQPLDCVVAPEKPKAATHPSTSEDAEKSRVDADRVRLQSLWIARGIRGSPPKYLKSLRKGLKEAGVAF